MNIFKLVGSVILDGASNVEGQLDSIDTKGKKAGSAFSAFGKVAKGVGVAVTAAGAGVTALGGAITKVASSNDVIDKMSQKIGISTTSYQEWSYAMGQSGVDITKLQTAMVKVTDAADKALNGNEAYASSFETLGVALTNADGSMRSQEDILNESILALADMEDTTQRAIIGNDLFGKSFSDLNPLLNSGSDGITALKDRAHELGIVIDEDAIKAGASFGDTLSDLKQSLGSVVTKGLSPLMPALQGAGEALTGLLTGQEGAAEEFSSNITAFITQAIDTIVSMLPTLMEAGSNILFSLIDGLITNIGSIVDTAAVIVFSLIDAIVNNLPEILVGAVEIIVALANGIVEAIPTLLEKVPQIIIAVVDGLLDALPALMIAGPEIMIALIKGIIGAIPTLVASLPQIVTAIANGLAGAVSEFVQLGKDIMSGLVQGIKGFAMKPVEAVKEAGSKVVNGFKNFFGIESPSKLFKSFGKFMMEGLGIGIDENADVAVKAASSISDKVKGVFGGIGNSLVSGVGGLNSLVGGVKSGFDSSGVLGGVTGGAMALVSESPQFQELIDKLTPVMETLTELFSKLIEPILPIVDILISKVSPIFDSLSPLLSVLGEVLGVFANIVMSALMPALTMLSPVLEVITMVLQNVVLPIVNLLYEAFSFVYNTIAKAINGIISAIDSVPFIKIKWRMPEMDGGISTVDSSEALDTSYNSEPESVTSTSTTKGGTQISEITGATRDLFVDILSPLASLDSLSGIGTKIYDLLDDRLINTNTGQSVNISNVTINTNGVDGRRLGEDFMDAVELELKRRNVNTARGFANA